MIGLPEEFINKMTLLFGKEEGESLIKALDSPPVVSVRLNRRKPGAEFSGGIPVEWCKSGLYLSERPQFIFDPLLHVGAYYVQEASSMIYESVIEKLVAKFKSLSHSDNLFLKVLDLCAAPGGKTTAMINALPDGCEVTANEFSSKRVGALRENLERWGYPHVITNKDTSFYARQIESYDIIAVDAPCSGEGMMRKEEEARRQWSQKLINQCSSLQKEIISNAVEALKPGGFLIYSTCTFNREENEDNAEFIRSQFGWIPVDMEFPASYGIASGIETDIPVYRFLPHKIKGEGLFLAVFQKPGEWMPNKSPSLSIQKDKQPPYPEIEVDYQVALSYLRGESIILPEETPRGIINITYKGYPLGQAKNIGTRANNLLPKNRRILKR